MVKQFVVRVLDDFAREHPELIRNAFIAGVLETMESNG